jgi:hypothetical protein
MAKGLGYTAKFTKTGTVELPDPSTYTLGIVGSMADSGWATDIPLTYVEGTQWSFTANYTFAAGDEFKVRTVGTWEDINLGYDHVTITGDASNIVNKGGNLQCTEAASYKITVTYDGPSDSWTIDLKK